VQSGLSNTRVEMGASALVEANGVEILLCSLRNQAMGTDLFTGIGCDLAAKKIVVVKSSQHFHASYSKIAARVIYAAAPGAVTHDAQRSPTARCAGRSGRSSLIPIRLRLPFRTGEPTHATSNPRPPRRQSGRCRPARRGALPRRCADQDAEGSSPTPT
jgi:hypothetical protein